MLLKYDEMCKIVKDCATMDDALAEAAATVEV